MIPDTYIFSEPMRYREALSMQRDAAKVCAQEGISRLLILQHPPVVTMGRDTKKEDRRIADEELRSRGIDVEIVERGGSVTYHGLGQLIAYPIMDANLIEGRARGYLGMLQRTVVDFLSAYGIASKPSEDSSHPGVFVDDEKIAAVGVEFKRAERRKVTMHGAAIYVNPDLSEFEHIFPCGDRNAKLTTMELELGSKPSMYDAMLRFADTFSRNAGIHFNLFRCTP